MIKILIGLILLMLVPVLFLTIVALGVSVIENILGATANDHTGNTKP